MSISIVSLAMGIFLADEHQVDCHADTYGSEHEAEQDGGARDSTWLPVAGSQLMNQLDMAKGGTESDDDAESDQSYSGPEGETGRANLARQMSVRSGELAEEEAETADCETNAHQSQAGADPCEEGSLSCEVDSGILFDRLVS